jgi:hypothetical protein
MIRTELDEALEDLAADVKRKVSTAPASPASGPPRTRQLKDLSSTGPVQKSTPSSYREILRSAFRRTDAVHVEDPAPVCMLTDQKTILFSERHPMVFKTSRLILPRVPVLTIALPLIYFMVANLLKGDYLFVIRWYRESWILPNLVNILSSKTAFMHWWKFYGPITVMVGLLISGSIIVFYMFIWRFIFKDYTRQTEGVETSEGRGYWVEGRNMWFNLWDLFYGVHYQRKYKGAYKPDRRVVTVYLNTNFFPPPNPSAPSRKMLKVKLSRDRDEWIENRGAYELVGHEGLYRRIIGIREMETHNIGYKSDPIAMREATKIFKDRMDGLVKDTQKLSKANVSVRLDQMKSGTVQMDDELREMINDQRKKKAAT